MIFGRMAAPKARRSGVGRAYSMKDAGMQNVVGFGFWASSRVRSQLVFKQPFAIPANVSKVSS